MLGLRPLAALATPIVINFFPYSPEGGLKVSSPPRQITIILE